MTFEHKFEGGKIVPREAGEMFDQKTGKKTTWEKGVKILGETKPIVLTARQLYNVKALFLNEQFIAWLNEE
jgi:hypothetical protein